MVIASGWAFAVVAGVFTAIACGSSDAHLNPALTMGFAVSSGHFGKFAPYLLAQMAGAFTGAILVWLHFLPHWEQTPDQGLKLACFCTAPEIRRFGANLISEILGTLVLVLVVGAIFSKAVADTGPAVALGAISCRSTRLGYRTFSWENYWLCDKSRSGLRTSTGARCVARRG